VRGFCSSAAGARSVVREQTDRQAKYVGWRVGCSGCGLVAKDKGRESPKTLAVPAGLNGPQWREVGASSPRFPVSRATNRPSAFGSPFSFSKLVCIGNGLWSEIFSRGGEINRICPLWSRRQTRRIEFPILLMRDIGGPINTERKGHYSCG